MSTKMGKGWLHFCKGCHCSYYTRKSKGMLSRCPKCTERFRDIEQVNIAPFHRNQKVVRESAPYPADFTNATRYWDNKLEFFCAGTNHGELINYQTGQPFRTEWVTLVPEVYNYFSENDDYE